MDIDRNTAIKLIRQLLRARSGRAWSVTGGSGTAHGWITIHAAPRDRTEHGYLNEADQQTLAKLLGLARPVHHQGESIPAGLDYYREYVDRAAGRQPSVHGQPYWD